MESTEVFQEITPVDCSSYDIQFDSQDHLDNSWSRQIETISLKPAPSVVHADTSYSTVKKSFHQNEYSSKAIKNEGLKVEVSRPPSSRGKDIYNFDIKQESCGSNQECVLCTGRTDNSFDVFNQKTYCGHVTLCSFICKVAKVELDPQLCVRKYACRSCYELLNVVEQAEIEYLKHRDILLDIVRQNSTLKKISDEKCEIKVEDFKFENDDTSDDEPLAVIKSSNASKPKNDSKSKTESPLKIEEDKGTHQSELTDDDDFYWELDNKEDLFREKKGIKCSFKKRGRPKKSKNIKHKEEEIATDPSEILLVELKEDVKLEDGEVPVSKKKKTKTKEKKKESKELKENKQKKQNLTCAECNKTFSQKAYYDCHMARHDPSLWPYICEICGKGFYNRKICDTHVLMHQGIAEYKCIPCNKLFLTKFAFQRHDKIHQGKPKHQCDLCGKSFIHTSSFRMHKMIHAGIKKHSCDICGLAMLSSSHLIRHKRIHSGEKRFECDVCGKKFTEKYNMQVHSRVHMKNEERPPTPTDLPVGKKRWFRCERCEEKFDRLFKLEIHLVDDHKVVLKKGRPKPRNTMKKLQRAQQAAASMVTAFASAIEAKRVAEQLSMDGVVDVKPSVDALDEKIKKSTHGKDKNKANCEASAGAPASTTTSGAAAARQYMQQEQMFRTAGTVWPHMTYSMGLPGYLGRMPDYSPPN